TAAELALPRTAAPTAEASGAATATDEEERRQLLDVLEGVAWNFSRAAARLGGARNTLRYRAQRLGLAGPVGRRGGPPRNPWGAGTAAVRGAPAEAQEERRRLTFVVTRLVTDGMAGAPWELSRALEATVEKVRSFGGRVEASSPEGVVAVFGVEPDED